MKKAFFLYLILFGLSVISFAQSNRIIDLETKIETATKAEQLPLLQELAKLYLDVNPSKSSDYIEEAQKIAKREKITTYDATLLNILGEAYFLQENYRKSSSSFEDELSLLKLTADKESLMRSHFNLATVYEKWEKTSKAAEEYGNSLAIAKELNLPDEQMQVYFALYIVYMKNKDYQNALEYYLRYNQLKELKFNITSDKEILFMRQRQQQTAAKIAELDAEIVIVEGINQQLRTDSLLKASQIQQLEQEQLLKDAQLDLEKEQVALRDALIGQQQTQLIAIIIIVVLMLLSGLFLLRMYRQKRAANILLSEKNNEISEKNSILSQQKEEIETQAEQLMITNTELEKLSLVASKTDNSVLILDTEGQIEWVNEGFVRMYGYHFDEFSGLFGSNVNKSERLTPLAETLENARKIQKSVVANMLTSTKNEDEIWIQTTLTPITNEDDEVIKFIAIESDITEIKKAEHKIAHQKKDIEDSIHYASRIQTGILPPVEMLNDMLPQNFILFKPKDIVSGDFYWMHPLSNDQIIVTAADCTGHGVPGAFMSMLGVTFLHDIVHDIDSAKVDVAEILNLLRMNVIRALRQEHSSSQDGMDIAMLIINTADKTAQYAGAYNSLYLAREGEAEILQYKADRMPIGIYRVMEVDNMKSFTRNDIVLQKNDCLYLFSDGFQDQTGGEKFKKFLAKNFRDLLFKISPLPMAEQKAELSNRLAEWQGRQEQIDDIIVIGLRV